MLQQSQIELNLIEKSCEEYDTLYNQLTTKEKDNVDKIKAPIIFSSQWAYNDWKCNKIKEVLSNCKENKIL